MMILYGFLKENSTEYANNHFIKTLFNIWHLINYALWMKKHAEIMIIIIRYAFPKIKYALFSICNK